MIREMMGIIQLKKYRTMKQRYGNHDNTEMHARMKRLEERNK
jgi:hypothetical protein